VIFSWLAMQAVHELGHVLGAWATGGRVYRVVLHPLTISQTNVAPNPQPLVEVWAGPVIGAALPLAFYAMFWLARAPGQPLARFFAGFCLIANGLYIGIGSVVAIADADELLQYGAARWQLGAFGLATVPLGLFLWHRLGPAFGLGAARGQVARGHLLTSLFLLVLLVIVELWADLR